jgi:SAM-dependent methyltransferase
VLEILDDAYTRRYGEDRVIHSDVLHAEPGNAKATIVGDLTCAEHIPSDTFDCVILTQTLQLIYDVPAALRTVHRILKPGGVLLATIPGISPISRYDMDRWGYYWAFTTRSAQSLFSEAFSIENVQIDAHGNVLSAISLLLGLASEELSVRELDHVDPDYQVIITIRAEKPQESWRGVST